MIAKEKFTNAVKKAGVYFKKQKNKYDSPTYCLAPKKREIDLETDYLYVKWCTGGITGGSCWEDGNDTQYHSFSGDPEPEFDAIDGVLLDLCPQITFLQYRKILRKIVHTGTYSEDEYYGNSTTYAFKSVKLQELFDTLVEMELLQDD